MRRLAPKRPRVVPDITALIDVVFLLLIFFMVTTTFVGSEREIPIDLPGAASGEVESVQHHVVHITAAGKLFFHGQEVDRDSLIMVLGKALQEFPEKLVIVSADKTVAHGRVVEILDIARQLGGKQAALAVEIIHKPAP
jgi:biopolymer transport protein ExbD